MSIPEEAIKAATGHLLATAKDPYGWLSDMQVIEIDTGLGIVETGACGTIDVVQAVEEVLMTTLPHIRAQIAADIRDEMNRPELIEMADRYEGYFQGQRSGLEDAARIAEEGTRP